MQRPQCPIQLLLSTIVAFTCLLHVVNAAKPKWISTNPGGGGAFNSPVITPQGYYVVGSDLGGLYWSRNDGSSWTAVGATSGLETTHISSLAAHPLSGRWVIGTEDGIYLSRNAKGKKIRKVYDGGYMAAIGVGGEASSNPDVMYAAEHAGYDTTDPTVLLRSLDGGVTWSRQESRGLERNGRIVALRLHPVDSDAVWVITGEGRAAESPGRAFLSTDAAQTFTRRDPNDGQVVDLAFAMDGANLNRVFLTVIRNEEEGALYESDDAGFSWKKVIPDESVSGGRTGVILANGKGNPNHVRLVDFNFRSETSETLLWETFNGGKAWTRRSNVVQGGWSTADEVWGMGESFQGALQTIGYSPFAPQVALWVNSQFVYHTTDGGQTWHDVCSNSMNQGRWISRGVDNVVPVVVTPTGHGVTYAGYADVGLWKSNDNGRSWQSLNMDLDAWTNAGLDPDDWWGSWGDRGGNTVTIATDPDRANVLWASMGEYQFALLKSMDQGRTFQRIAQGLPKDLTRLDSLSLAADSFVDARWIFVVANGNVYLNENDGDDEWTMVLDCQGVCQGVRYSEGGGVYAYGPATDHSGLWHSWEGGVKGSWYVVESLPSNVRDGGWTPGLHWIDDHWEFRGPVDLVTRDEGREVWLVIRGQGVYYSSNYNASWKLVMKHEYARSVAVAVDSREVYVATSSAFYAGGYETGLSQGLWVHRKGGTKAKGWKLSNKGLAWPFATFVTIEPETGARWLISPGQGIMQWK